MMKARHMRKTYIARILIIFITAVALLNSFARAQQTAEGPVTVIYDRFKNRTTEMVTVAVPRDNDEGPPRMFIEFGYTYAGKKLMSRPRTVFVIIRSFSRNLMYDRENSFITLVDGKRLLLGRMRRYEIGSYSEGLAADINYKDFQKLAEAKKVEMQIGVEEFELNEAAMQSLRALSLKAVPIRGEPRPR